MSSITKEVLSSLSSEKLLYCDRLCLLEYQINVWSRFLVRLAVNKIYLAEQCISKNYYHTLVFLSWYQEEKLFLVCVSWILVCNVSKKKETVFQWDLSLSQHRNRWECGERIIGNKRQKRMFVFMDYCDRCLKNT